MADFAIPLSSMAVGFGSSLFGVISAILLSIKGYLLNKAQESLLAGVENWLQEKTVEKVSGEDKAGALTPSTMLDNHQKSYMDVFVEQIAALSYEMREVSAVNKQFQSTFIETMRALKSSSQQEQEFLYQMKNSLEDIAKSSIENSTYSASNQAQLQELLIVQKSQNDQLHEISSKSLQAQETIQKREDTIAHMVIKQERKEQENKINIFHMADSLESVDKNIKQRLSKLESLIQKKSQHADKHSKFEDTIDFMKKHFSQEEKV
jgi:hypothetical protein